VHELGLPPLMQREAILHLAFPDTFEYARSMTPRVLERRGRPEGRHYSCRAAASVASPEARPETSAVDATPTPKRSQTAPGSDAVPGSPVLRKPAWLRPIEPHSRRT
jgi:hypothetical protein